MRKTRLIAGLVGLAASVCQAQTGGSFHAFAFPDSTFQGLLISDDCTTVAGQWRYLPPGVINGPYYPAVWRPGQSYEAVMFPGLPAGTVQCVSGDGGVVSMRSWDGSVYRSYAWQAGGEEGVLVDAPFISAVSRNGRFVAGTGETIHEGNGVYVTSLMSGETRVIPMAATSVARWISDDGERIAGWTGDGLFYHGPDGTRVVEAGGSIGCWSGDGTAVIGQVLRPGAQHWSAALWVGSVSKVLPGLDEGPETVSRPTDVANGGAAVVGVTGRFSFGVIEQPRPWYWSPETGSVGIAELLRRAGVDTAGYDTVWVSAISDDGRRLAGTAVDPGTGEYGYWMATLPALCAADIGMTGGAAGRDWVLDNNDLVQFVTYFFLGDPLADRGVQGGLSGSDGVFDNNDFIVFIEQFFAGC
jgi:hypothetical protein